MAKKVGGIEYKRDFNAGLIRQMLGLDGAVPWDLPSWERERLATMLRRGHKITKREVRQLGGEIIRRENMEGI